MPPGDYTHATDDGRVFGVTPVRSLSSGYTMRKGGNLLARLNTTFAAGLRGAGVYTRTDRQDAVFSEGTTPGGRALALQPDQAFISEMLAIEPGRYTLAFDVRIAGAARVTVTTRVCTSYQTADGEVRRPVYGESRVEVVPGDWQRISIPVVVPEGSPGLNLQIGEAGAVRDAFASDAPGWSNWPDGEGPVVMIDRLALRPGETSSYIPAGPIELALGSPASAWLATEAGGGLPLIVSLANPGAVDVAPSLTGLATDVLYGTVYALSLPPTGSLAPGEIRETPFTLALPAGQFLVELAADVDGERVTVARPVTFFSPARLKETTPARSPFIGRALYNSASHESCRMLGAPSSRLLGDGMPYPLNWQVVQPRPGAFVWDDSDRFIGKLAEAGMSPLVGLLNYNRRTVDGAVTVLSPPEWVASELPGPGAWPSLRKAVPVDIESWCDYVRAVATRYRDRIRAWEVINEPSGIMSADAYVRLLAAAWRTLKEVDPEFTVVGICTTGDEVNGAKGGLVSYLEVCFALGAARFLDVISFHPYVWPHSPERGGLPESLATIKTLCARHAPGKPLWSTEFGWNSPVVVPDRLRTERGPGRNLCAGEYTALDCANFVARGLLHQLGAGIAKIHLFNNPQPGRMHPFRANGLNLFDYDRTPLPVFIAAREVIQRLTHTRLHTHEETAPGVFFQIHLHDENESRSTVVIWRSEDAVTRPSLIFALPAGAGATPADLFGRTSTTMAGQCHVPLSASPIFIEVTAASPDLLRRELNRILS